MNFFLYIAGERWSFFINKTITNDSDVEMPLGQILGVFCASNHQEFNTIKYYFSFSVHSIVHKQLWTNNYLK